MHYFLFLDNFSIFFKTNLVGFNKSTQHITNW